MSTRNIIALILIIISLLCLYPGLVKPIMSFKASADIPLLGNVVLTETTQSVVSTIRTLWEQNNKLVAILILLFSIMVPLTKAVSQLAILFFKPLRNKPAIHKFIAAISKWSMADVFVVGVLLTFMTTQSDENMQAWLHEGFYYFLAYCIISIIGVQFLDVKDPSIYE